MRPSLERGQNRIDPPWVGYAITVLAELLVTLGLRLLLPLFPLAKFPMPYVVLTMMAAYLFGLGPAILAFVVGFICFAYFFPPYHGIWPPAVTSDDWAGIVALLLGSSISGFAAYLVRESRNGVRASEARHRSLIETMNEGFCAADADYVLTYVNQHFAEMLGHSQIELIGRRVHDLLDELSRTRLEEGIQERRSGRFAPYELTWIASDGQAVDTLVSPRSILNSDGTFAGSFATITDITELRRSQEAIRESESRYRQLFQNANDAIFLLEVSGDSLGRFLDANDVACERLGYTREELTRLGPGDVDAPETVEDIPRLTRLVREQGHATFEIVQLSRDGRRIPSEVSAHLFWMGEDEVVLAIARDVTERKLAEEKLRRSEERFRNLFERAADCLFLHDLQGRFVEVNRAACETLGYTREELLGLTVSAIVMDYDRQALENLWSRLMISPLTVDAIHRRKDGSTFPVEGHLSLLEYRGETHVLAVVRDITERKRAEEERRALEQHMEEQKRSFYRDTIFSVTDGKLDICDERDITEYLSTAEMEQGVRSNREVSDARRAVEEFLREHDLGGDRLDAFMIGVGEAITNAVKHGNEGSVSVGARNGSVWVGIADSGPGIESLILPRAVLLRGFSTKPSLGLGYCVMLNVADRIHLKTDETGTIVILEKEVAAESGEPSLDRLPDTWGQIQVEDLL